ncbi:MAG TPA: DnaB-like helicase N-terminal domain-containing protein [Lacipirellulaceae bacterium]|nr:DnaB-like helicase N-terminal domain-containing protein [Lacipirellulaceae bacterium]
MNTEPEVPRADEHERYLLACLMDWPERAGEVLPLCRPTDFFDPMHQKLWRTFATQHATTGTIDRLAAGKQLGCCDLLIELTDCAPTTVHAESRAKMVRDAAQLRELDKVLDSGRKDIRARRPTQQILAKLQLHLAAIQEAAV